jgi:putative CocE/NonD family hydrolase
MLKKAMAALLGTPVALVSLAAAAPDIVPDQAKISLEWGVKVPLRDGINLSAAVYLPKGQPAPTYCVFTLTPYTAQTYHDRGVYFAARGVPFVIVDVRGRGNSDGTFAPFIQERKDGYDVVEWLAKQPYCNGKVSMWGGSYSGYNQWATERDHPPHLATLIPAAAAEMGFSSPQRNNIFSPGGLLYWALYVDGKSSQQSLWEDRKLWAYFSRDRYLRGDSFESLANGFAHDFKWFNNWIAHPELDGHWAAYMPQPIDYSGMNLPVLQITGSYDIAQLGAFDYYRKFQKFAPPAARDRNYLVIGPWDHAATRTPRIEIGGVKFGPASMLDLGKLHLDWYSWTMGSGAKPLFLKKHIAYYVMGADKWRYAETLDGITAAQRALTLSSAKNANTLANPGSLSAAGKQCCSPDHYIYDPRDVSTADLQVQVDQGSNVDTRLIKAFDGKQLVYESAPFAASIEISGFFRLSTWIAIDQPDTDFSAAIYEITSSGQSIFLTNNVIRARYRNDLSKTALVNTRGPLLYNFDNFLFTSRQLAAGSKIRMVFGPINSIYVQKNYNSGGIVAKETMKDARPVSVKLFHDAAHPSTLYVPIAQPGE